MGQVYAADDRRLEQRVAVKVPDLRILMASRGAEAFLHEARLAARLGPHPNVVQIKACLRPQLQDRRDRR
jgi:hypothetical protein